jgi:alpha-tubulin suppressor-like RCC1 family protein
MAEPERPERFELRVTDIDDPLPDATFGSIDRYAEVARPDGLDEPFVPQRLVLEFDEKRAEHVDPYSLALFEVDLESCTFTPLDSSRVDVDGRKVTAWVDHPAIYGLIGLPKHPGVLETLRLLDRFGPQLLEERERGEHGLQDRICGLILCADPTMWGGGPIPPGDLCARCLGLDVSFGRLPERFLLEGRPPLRPLREEEQELEPAGMPSILAWGRNSDGQLGDGTKIQRPTPVWVPGLTAKKLVGTYEFTLALSTDGTVWSWGANGSGQLGNGTLAPRSSPGRVAGLTDVVDIAAGIAHALAVRSDGSIWTWGWRRDAGGPIFDSQPVPAAGSIDAVAVAIGNEHSLALGRDGRVWSWGKNYAGQLGDGTRLPRANPALVPGLTAVRSIAAGFYSSFAVKVNGAVAAWGYGLNGELGDGAQVDRLTPVAVPGLGNIEQVSAGHFHGLARTAAGELWAWGACGVGQSGDGTRNFHPTPVNVPGLQKITGIAAGGYHNVACQANGTVWVWGSGAEGQVGDGGTADRLTPFAVPLPSGRLAAGVGAGTFWSFAMLS